MSKARVVKSILTNIEDLLGGAQKVRPKAGTYRKGASWTGGLGPGQYGPPSPPFPTTDLPPSLGKRTRNWIGEHPVQAGIAGTALAFSPQIAGEVGEAFGMGFEEDLALEREMNRAAVERKKRMERLQRLMAQNTMRIAQMNPHLFQEIMAGRKLPQDATVFGGEPRMDLMEEVVYGMTEGNYDMLDGVL